MHRVLELIFDVVGHARPLRWVQDARRDAAHGLRVLRRSPVFAVTAILSLAIGIGANTAIFTIANALLFRPPAGIADPDALVSIGSARGDGGLNPLPYAAYLEIAERTTTLTSVFAEEMFPHVMGLVVPSGTHAAEPVVGRSVTTNFFKTLGTSSWRGRLFVDADDAAVVLAYDYWKQRFTGDEAVIGRMLHINGRPVTVVGVAAPGFQGTGIRHCDLWLTFGASRRSGPVLAGGRMRASMEPAAAAAEVRAIGDAMNRAGGSGLQVRQLNALPFSRAGGDRNIVLGFAAVLLTLVSLVLVAACANVAGILLTRATARSREMALRAALGAARGRLVRQLLSETAVLFLCGGLVGVGLARLLIQLAVRLLPALPTRIDLPLALDWRVLLFALSLSIGAAALFGVLPAFRGSRVDVGTSLKDGVWSTSGGSRLRSAFVVSQVACAVLLVVLSASFVRILRHAGAADPGFDAHGVEVATIDLAVTGEPSREKVEFWHTMLDRMEQLPAVEAVSLARVPPGGWEGIGLGDVVPDDRERASNGFSPSWNIVERGYFSTLRIPLVEGRDFASTDSAGAPTVVIVSHAVARRLWPGQSAIGQSLRLPPVNANAGRTERRLATVIGVVGDIRSSSLIDGLAEPYVYLAVSQSEDMGMIGLMSIVARSRGATSLAAPIATVVQQVDPRLVLARTESLADAIALGLTPQRVVATISGVMGLVALLLTSMGIYGVTAYTVALRRREFAIRLALGAPRARVVRMVFRQGTVLVTVGLCLGLAVGLAVVHVISTFLYGLPAVHWPTLAGTVVLFGVIGTAASMVPASQAVRGGWRRSLHED